MKHTFAERMTVLTAVFGVLHHIDHVLRFDHSGWPFKPDVTPFTYSLLVYPLMASILFLRGYPRMRVALALVLFLFPTLAHIFLETPLDQFHTWAHLPRVNLLRTSSPVLGATAMVTTVLLSGCAFLTLVAFWREAQAARLGEGHRRTGAA